MAYKNTLKDYLTFEKLKEDKSKIDKYFNQEREYQLSFKSDNYENNPHHMTIKNVIDYVQTNYVEQDTIEKGNLINDLVVFKTCRDNIELGIDDQGFIINILAIQIATYAVIVSIVCKDMDLSETNFPIVLLSVLILVLDYLYMRFRSCKSSQYSKLRTINDVVHTLEAIKENLVAIPDSKEFEIEVKSKISQKSDECMDSKKYILKFAESLEDKSK